MPYLWSHERMLKELALIEAIAKTLPQGPADLGDDTYFDPDTRQLLTTDLLIEDQHFSQAYCSPADIGWKALAVNLSDIAAMGGQPTRVLVSLGLPDSADTAFVQALYGGMLSLLEAIGSACRIVGGDITYAPRLVINVAVVGNLPAGSTPGLRSSARVGDVILTTGPHGLAQVGLLALQTKRQEYEASKQAHCRPWPRLKEGQLIAKTCPRVALMDTSDGLADALLKIAHSSGVRLEIEDSRIERHPELRRFAEETGAEARSMALYGGEDFQLLATVADGPALVLLEEAGFQRLGRVVTGEGAAVVDATGAVVETLLLEKTYAHFASKQPEGVR